MEDRERPIRFMVKERKNVKKPEELIREITELTKETKAGKINWTVQCQTTEYNPKEEKPVVEEDGIYWTVDECYVEYYCQNKGQEFVMITYEMIHSCGEKKKTTNLVFLPPLGMRYFDIKTLLPYAVENSQMLSYAVHTLWLQLLESSKEDSSQVVIDASPRQLVIEEDEN